MDYYEHKLDPVGVRPDWLADGDAFEASGTFGTIIHVFTDLEWSKVARFRIPRDHWAVPALERGFKPWSGGERAPSDWDGGEVLTRSGLTKAWRSYFRWKDHGAPYDVIGYRPKPTASEHPEYSPELVEAAKNVLCHFTDDGLHKKDINRSQRDDVAKLRAILSELDKSKEVDPLVEVLGAVSDENYPTIETEATAFRLELDKRGYAITRKDESQ